MTQAQARLIRFAAAHRVHAEPRIEGDVVVFCELCLDGRTLPYCEVATAADILELRAVLGY